MRGVREQLEKVSRNLALAESAEQHRAIAAVFDELTEREVALSAEIATSPPPASSAYSVESEVEAALGFVGKLTALADEPLEVGSARLAFELSNLRLFLRFTPLKLKKRTVNRVVAGVVTLGAETPQ